MGAKPAETNYSSSPQQQMMMGMMMPMLQNMMAYAMKPPGQPEYGVDQNTPYWSPDFGSYSPQYSYPGMNNQLMAQFFDGSQSDTATGTGTSSAPGGPGTGAGDTASDTGGPGYDDPGEAYGGEIDPTTPVSIGSEGYPGETDPVTGAPITPQPSFLDQIGGFLDQYLNTGVTPDPNAVAGQEQMESGAPGDQWNYTQLLNDFSKLTNAFVAGGDPNMWNILQGPAAPNMPSAQGMYTNINQPGIPSYGIPGYTPSTYNIPGLSNVQAQDPSGYAVPGYGTGGYDAAQIGQPGNYSVEQYQPGSYTFNPMGQPASYDTQAYDPSGYNVQGYSPQGMATAQGWNLPADPTKNPGDYAVPSIAGMQPNTDFWNNLDPDIKKAVMQPYEEASKQLQEQMGAYGQLGTAGAGLTGAAGKALGEYWTEQAIPNITREAFNLAQPGEQAKFAAELQKAQTFAAGSAEQERWVAEQTVDKNKWEAMTTATRDQWLADANLTSQQFDAMETTKQNATFAAMQTDAAKWKAMSDTDKDKWFAMAQMDTAKYNSMGAVEQDQWDAHVKTEANRWFAMSQTEQNQWSKMMAMDADKWNGMSDNQKRQWDANAQLEAKRFTAMSTLDQNKYVAQQENLLKQWEDQTNADREEMLLRANIDKGQFDAMNKTQQSLWFANASLEQKKSEAEKKFGLNTQQYNLAIQEAQTDYQNATSKLQLDYATMQNQYGQAQQQQQFPWQQLQGFFGAGMPQGTTTPGTQGFNPLSLLPYLIMSM